jgi:Ras-related protein Rab-1A
MHNGKAYKFELWDTAGQEKFRAITKSYYVSKNCIYLESDIVLITYSLSDSGSFEEATKFWLEEVKAYAPHAIIVLLGNK